MQPPNRNRWPFFWMWTLRMPIVRTSNRQQGSEAVALEARQLMRAQDSTAGGDEFCILMRSTNASGAAILGNDSSKPSR